MLHLDQFKARQSSKREEADGEAVTALREQLDQVLRRLSEAEDDASLTTRCAVFGTVRYGSIRAVDCTQEYVCTINDTVLILLIVSLMRSCILVIIYS